MLRAEPTARFDVIAPAGFRLLAALDTASRCLQCELVITSGTDRLHSGPDDPHKLGCAYDVRSHTFTEEHKPDVLRLVMGYLGSIESKDGGIVAGQFFGWLEQAGQPSEHFHFQLRKGAVYD